MIQLWPVVQQAMHLHIEMTDSSYLGIRGFCVCILLRLSLRESKRMHSTSHDIMDSIYVRRPKDADSRLCLETPTSYGFAVSSTLLRQVQRFSCCIYAGETSRNSNSRWPANHIEVKRSFWERNFTPGFT